MKLKPPDKRAIVISDLGGGGTQRVVLELCKAWSDQGYDLTVITLTDQQPGEISLPADVRRVALDLTGATGGIVAAVRANWQRVRALRDAIETSQARKVISFLAATNILMIIACRGLDLRLIISERNDPHRQPLGSVWQILRKFLYKRADVVTANSMQAVSSLGAYVPKEKLLFVPNPPPHWDDLPPPVDARKKILLAVGRLHHQKGYDLMLPIFAASKAQQAGWRLVILGNGPQRAALEENAEQLGIADCVTFPGHEHDVKSWYDRSGVFIQTSRYEGTSNALLEAISRRLPAIISRTAGDGPSWVERLGCGIVIDPCDIMASAAALDDMIENRAKRRELGTSGAENLPRLLSNTSVLEAWEAAIDDS